MLTAGIFTAILIITLALFVSVSQSRRQGDTARQVEHTQELLKHLQKLLITALDNETGARGYVITGDSIFLQPLYSSEKNFSLEMSQLRELLKDVPQLHPMLDTMEDNVQKRMAFSRQMVLIRQTDSIQKVTDMVRSGKGKHYTDQIRSTGEKIEAEGNVLLDMRRKKNDNNIRNLNIILYSVLTAAAFMGIYIILQIRKDLKTRESNEKKFLALLDAAPDATVIVDTGGIIKMVNQQTERLFGYNKEEMVGHPVEILIPEQLRNIHTHHRDGFIKSAKVRSMGAGIELHAIRKDGSAFPVEISLSPIYIEGGMMVSAAVRDITERKKMETVLRKTNEELEAFSYSVSHDLRAPLRAIVGYTSILEEDYSSKLDEEAKRITGIIKHNTLSMSRLIDDLLSFSRLGRQELLKIPVQTDSLVEEIINEFRRQPENSHIQWNKYPLPPVYADLNTLRQVWVNLISNAVKYSSRKENPQIQVGHVLKNKEHVFFVRDNGVGFDDKYSHKLFRVFQRLHSTEEFEGTGVGLALSEKIISRHGGRIWAEGVKDKGACFYFSIPVQQS